MHANTYIDTYIHAHINHSQTHIHIYITHALTHRYKNVIHAYIYTSIDLHTHIHIDAYKSLNHIWVGPTCL